MRKRDEKEGPAVRNKHRKGRQVGLERQLGGDIRLERELFPQQEQGGDQDTRTDVRSPLRRVLAGATPLSLGRLCRNLAFCPVVAFTGWFGGGRLDLRGTTPLALGLRFSIGGLLGLPLGCGDKKRMSTTPRIETSDDTHLGRSAPAPLGRRIARCACASGRAGGDGSLLSLSSEGLLVLAARGAAALALFLWRLLGAGGCRAGSPED